MLSAQKIVISFWLIAIGLFITTPVLAQDPQPLDQTNFNYFINAQTTIEGAIGHTICCSLAGLSPFNEKGCLGYSAQTKQPLVFKQLPSGGALGVLGSTMVAFYTHPPTSSTYYLASWGENIGFSLKPAYAQSVTGSGEAIIKPILELWKAVRNLAYLAFTVVFLIIGLMIMLRRKVNPQTIISAQAALPGLVIGLILVTFSYFIAALIIDLAFVGIQIVAQLFISSGLTNSLGDVKQAAQNSNVFQLFSSSGLNFNNMGIIQQGLSGQISNIFGGGIVGSFLPAVILGIIGIIVGFLAGGGPVGAALGGATGASIGASVVIPVIVIIILLVALFIQLFRLLFALLGSYIQILVFTLAGPFFILIGSIPGRGNTITAWLKGLIANTLVFPAVFAVFLFAGVILGNSTSWTNTTLPLFGGLDANFIRALIAYGILLGSPAVPEMVRAAFGVKGPQGIVQAALGGFTTGAGAALTGYRQGTANIAREREEILTQRTKGIVEGTPPQNLPELTWKHRLPFLKS